ncbi:MAG: GNAT family N-acetyltransferase [Rhodobacteraceae bacterium]|nr:GNAT family N-acetyltransferase [Paracoccaceae bacterium]
MQGRFCSVVALDPDRHTQDLFDAYSHDRLGTLWTYFHVGPFATEAELKTWLTKMATTEDPVYYVVEDASTGKATGIASLMRIQPEHGVIEVGGICFSPLLQRTAAATEAMFLMMCRVFHELRYRRYEWKCDALNAPSRSAAERLGFTYDGTFRQAIVYKGRNRDTAWFSILDSDWPALKRAFLDWLSTDNLSANGIQETSLAEFVRKHRVSRL